MTHFLLVPFKAFSGDLFILGDRTDSRTVTAIAALAGLGTGGPNIPVDIVAIITTPNDIIATTVSLTLAIRILGGTIGCSIYSNIFSTNLTAKFPALVRQHPVEASLPPALVSGFITALLTKPASITANPGITPEIIITAGLKA